MGPHERRLDQASRSLPDPTGVRQGHDATDANLRRQRESKVAALGRRLDPPHQNTCVCGLAVSRAARYHGGEVRLECGDAEVAPLQPQSLADMVAVNTPFIRKTLTYRRAPRRDQSHSNRSRPRQRRRYLIRDWLSAREQIDQFGQVTYRISAYLCAIIVALLLVSHIIPKKSLSCTALICKLAISQCSLFHKI